jgi:hypothetical protein
MPRLDQKLLSNWQWEGGAAPRNGSTGFCATASTRHADRRNGRTPGTEPTEIFLDFDPVLPGWPADERAAGRALPRSP